MDALSARLDGFADSGVRGLCQEGRRVLSPMGAAEACEVLREMLLGRTSAEMELRKARVSRFPGGLPEGALFMCGSCLSVFLSFFPSSLGP